MTAARKQPRPTDDALMTVAEVGTFLHVRLARVYELINAGELPALRLGEKQLRIKRSELDAWLASCATTRTAVGARA